MITTISKSILHKYQELGFNLFIIISYVLIALTTFGVSSNSQKYLEILDYYVRIYICLFLIIRFNPLRKNIEFTSLDRKIAFSAGLFIATTSALNKYLEQIRTFFINKFNNN